MALDGSWIEELERASAQVHISRLEALEIHIRQQAEELHANSQQALFNSVKDIYTYDYYHAAFELATGVGFGVRLQPINDYQLDILLRRPWAPDGKDFSSRIWDNRDKLVRELHTELTHMAIRGDGPDEAIRNLARKMNTSKNNATKLIQTEHAAFGSKARQDCYTDLDVKRYSYIATLDLRTSEICAALDGQVFDLEDYEVGVNAPPMHPYCRSTTAPSFEDMSGIGTRAARDPKTGKTVQVPRDMTYEEWFDEFVNKGHMRQDQGGIKITKKSVQNLLTVDRQLVNSKAYHDKFEDLPFSKPTREALYTKAKEILEHRDGTDLEDFVVLDRLTGAEIAANRKATTGGKVGLSKRDFERVSASENGVVLLHNHPLNGRFSYADIKNAFATDFVKASVVVGHNGEVHVIHKFKKKETFEKAYMALYNKYKSEGLPNVVAEGRALDLIYEKGTYFEYEKR